MTDNVTEQPIELRLNGDEALVLFELLSRWLNPGDTGPTLPASAFAHESERQVLNTRLLAPLERHLVAPLRPEYSLVVADARNRIAK
jgi:hypothetical protein